MHKIGTFLMKCLLTLLGALPLKVHHFLGDILSFIIEKVARYRVEDVLINLSRSFPDKGYKEIKQIKHQFYKHLGEIAAEAVWFGGCRNPKRLRKSHICELQNPEGLKEFFDATNGIVVLVAHNGNWELYGGLESFNYSDVETGFTEQNFCVVYKRQSSAMWDEVLRWNRRAPVKDPNFDGYLESRELLRYVINHRGEKKIYNINTDQRPYKFANDEMTVEFMHRKCRTMTGAATVARKFHLGVAYLSMRPVRRGYYELEYIPICTDASTMEAEDIMRSYYKLLEKDIEAIPWNYLWTHRRWK